MAVTYHFIYALERNVIYHFFTKKRDVACLT